MCAADGHPYCRCEFQLGTCQGDLERRGILGIPNEEIPDPKRKGIDGAAPRHPLGEMPSAAQILDRRHHAGADDVYFHDSNASLAMRVNRTRSPGLRSATCFSVGLKSASGVRPMICQPPGEFTG